jgi:pyruvate dehydrogenase E1 component
VTSADLVFRAFKARRGLAEGPTDVLERLFPARRAAPAVTVLDGHPHTLAFLGAIISRPVACLGVSDFGQVGEVEDLCRIFGIDASTIVGAAWDLIDEVGAKDGPRSVPGG